MSRWVDIRVADEDAQRALQALMSAFPGSDLSIDTSPPASGPETAIAIDARVDGRPVGERGVVRVLGAAGVSVLAARERLGPALEIDASRR